MTSTEVLDRLHELGVRVDLNGTNVRMNPASKIPPDLLDEVRQHKAEIIQELRLTYGDGQPSPADKPASTEPELRRIIDHLADPDTFEQWLDWAMTYTDPAEVEGNA